MKGNKEPKKVSTLGLNDKDFRTLQNEASAGKTL